MQPLRGEPHSHVWHRAYSNALVPQTQRENAPATTAAEATVVAAAQLPATPSGRLRLPRWLRNILPGERVRRVTCVPVSACVYTPLGKLGRCPPLRSIAQPGAPTGACHVACAVLAKVRDVRVQFHGQNHAGGKELAAPGGEAREVEAEQSSKEKSASGPGGGEEDDIKHLEELRNLTMEGGRQALTLQRCAPGRQGGLNPSLWAPG